MKYLTDREHRVIFNSTRAINELDINNTLSFIKEEMDLTVEGFYQTKRTIVVNKSFLFKSL